MAASRDEPAYACDCDRGMTTALPDFLESWFHINLESLLQIQSAGSPPIRRPGSRVDRRGWTAAPCQLEREARAEPL